MHAKGVSYKRKSKRAVESNKRLQVKIVMTCEVSRIENL